MTAQDILEALRAQGCATKAQEMMAYHKTARPFLGVSAMALDEQARALRQTLGLSERCALADALWDSDIHEARIFAAKLLTQARIKDDAPVWALIATWAEGFDSWALADHASVAGAKRVQAVPARLDQLESWITHPNLWTRRAALVMTLPYTRLAHPKPAELAVRLRVLDWCAALVPDRDRFIQKAIAWWLRDLSRRDPQSVRDFLDGAGAGLSKAAKTEALRIIGPVAQEPPNSA